jgi:hypothetical protein
MSFKEVVNKLEERSTQVRTNYRCTAHGCPNAGTMGGDLCYWHFVADPLAWGNVTNKIRSNFEDMRNHGPAVPFNPQRRDMLLKRWAEA